MRIGHGYDVHRLQSGRKLILGGVEVPHEYGLMGHSDADVLVHSIIDALLGAACMGDIGYNFPDSDDKYLNANSLLLLENTVDMLYEKGYKIINIDSTLVAQAPKLAAFILQMRSNIAEACKIDIACVSVKATTEEGLGFTGEKAGIACHAVCLID